MQVNQFMHEMRETAAILGRDSGVNVVFEGDQAGTNGTTIKLPAMSLDKELTIDQIQTMRGYVDHEAGHHRHNDLEKVFDFYDRCYNNGQQSLKDIHNCLTDVWMENRVVNDYPGAHKNLRTLNEGMKKKELKSFLDNGAKDLLKEVNISSVGSGIKAQNPLYLTEGSNAQKFLDHTSEEVQRWTKKWADMALECKNDDDLIALSRAVARHLKQDPELQEDPEDFEVGEADEGMEGVGENSEGYKANKEGKGQKNPFTHDFEEGEGDGEGEPLKEVPDDYMPKEAEDIINSPADEDGVGGIGGSKGPLTGGYRVSSTSDDIEYRRGKVMPSHGYKKMQNIVDSTDHSEYMKVKSEISSEVNVMKSKLRRSLLARQRRDWDFGREVGRLDTKRLVGAYNGMTSVYKQRKDRIEADTTITILVDLSGSMGGRKAIVARDCAVALAECLEGSNMTFKIAGFCNKKIARGAEEMSGHYHRYERLDTVVFKDFNDPLKSTRGAIASIDAAVGGNNSDYDFIVNEINYLKNRPEQRKVLFVLSDGHPACYSAASTSEHVKHCKKAVDNSSKDGVECVGIGICDSAVEQIYKDHVVVQNVNDLSTSVFNKLTKLLLGGVKE